MVTLLPISEIPRCFRVSAPGTRGSRWLLLHRGGADDQRHLARRHLEQGRRPLSSQGACDGGLVGASLGPRPWDVAMDGYGSKEDSPHTKIGGLRLKMQIFLCFFLHEEYWSKHILSIRHGGETYFMETWEYHGNIMAVVSCKNFNHPSHSTGEEALRLQEGPHVVHDFLGVAGKG